MRRSATGVLVRVRMQMQMRVRMLVLGVLVFFAAFSIGGGTASAQGIDVGVKGGVNLAEAKIEGEGGSPPLDYRISGVAGVFFTLPLTSWLELQPEALYAMKGARYDVFDVKTTLALDYLEVPVLARYSIGRKGKGLRYYVAGGPTFGIRLRARQRVDFGNDVTEDIDMTDEIKRADLGVAVGGGVEKGRLVFDGRYTYGLMDVDKDKTDKVKITNRAISITAGFRF